MQRRSVGAGLPLALAAALVSGEIGSGCGGEAVQTDGSSTSTPTGTGGSGGGGVSQCAGLFDGQLRTFSIDISPAEWQSLTNEFNSINRVLAGEEFAVYHPVVLHMDGETVEAAVKLRGQSSWVLSVMNDGARAKMQFNVSFDETVPDAKFHGYGKLVFDMPRSDWTFLHDRLAHTWLRQAGIMAPCSVNARLTINGTFYGLYTLSEPVGGRLVDRFFPDNPDGDLWKGGYEAETNQESPNWTRVRAFRDAMDLATISSIVDIEGSIRSWAAEALLNNADGYYGGFHNFYAYDQGAKGFLYLPQDTDSTFEWLALWDVIDEKDHPIFWWEARIKPAPTPGRHWMPVLSDPTWRRKYADAIADLLTRWDVQQFQTWIDSWSAQIAADVAADPHTWADVAGFQTAIREARAIVATRPAYLREFVDCVKNGSGQDEDGDGFRWCEDCRDDAPSINLSVPEVCGNGLDDNCNGFADEGC
jgi:hypothetical protein